MSSNNTNNNNVWFIESCSQKLDCYNMYDLKKRLITLDNTHKITMLK